jgi:membrane protein involved in colicin uptake
MYNTMGLFDGLTSLFEGKTEVEKAQKKLNDIEGKCKVDTELANKALSDAKLKQIPADAAKVAADKAAADAAKVAADKAAADAKLVADKAAAEKAAADAMVVDAKAAVEKAAADVKPVDLKGGKSKRVRFSKKIKGGKNKKRVKTNKKRR